MTLSTPLLKKYGILIKYGMSPLVPEEVEVYFDSVLIREDWMSSILRYSLPESVPCKLHMNSFM